MKRHACVCHPGTRCMLGCVGELPAHMQIALDLEKCGSHVDVERAEATLAKLRAAEWNDFAWRAKFLAARQDDAAWLALFTETIEMAEALKRVAAGRLRDWGDPRKVQRQRRAAFIMSQHAARVVELSRRGVRNPITQAWKELAEQHGFKNAYALKRWVRNILRRG